MSRRTLPAAVSAAVPAAVPAALAAQLTRSEQRWLRLSAERLRTGARRRPAPTRTRSASSIGSEEAGR